MSYRLNVLLVLDHAPDYRETFFRELALLTRLTVVAQSCEDDGLAAPLERKGYEYIEIPTKRVAGIYWQLGRSGMLFVWISISGTLLESYHLYLCPVRGRNGFGAVIFLVGLNPDLSTLYVAFYYAAQQVALRIVKYRQMK